MSKRFLSPPLLATLALALTFAGCKRAEREAPKPPPAPAVKEAPARSKEQAMDALLAVPAPAERRVTADGVTDPVARVLLDSPVPHLDRLFDYLVPPRLDAAAGIGTTPRSSPARGAASMSSGQTPSPKTLTARSIATSAGASASR